MAKKKTKAKPQDHALWDFYSTRPRLTVLSDHPIDKTVPERDDFDLQMQMGPLFDIVRNPDSKLPLAVAIYGSWGTGKTSAMRWLEGLFGLWTDNLKDVKQRIETQPQGASSEYTDTLPRIKTIWFEPWRYQKREEVWRGLIAEVILKCIDVEDVDPKLMGDAVKRFGGFLGRSFIRGVENIKLKTPGTEVKFEALNEVIEDFNETNHPEKAFLNDFEQTFKTWLNTALGKNTRMVIFIDDLDRCMPDVTLEVLEALKLYLDLDNLVFIAGIDETVVQQVVSKYYEKLGVDETKSKQYLAKIFQIELSLIPTVQKISDFLDIQLKGVALWSDLSKEHQAIFKETIIHLAESNPREIKRLINRALIYGAGYLNKANAIAKTNQTVLTGIELAQGIQVIFIEILVRKIQPSILTRFFDGRQNTSLFAIWSTAVANGRGEERNRVMDCLINELWETHELKVSSDRDGIQTPRNANSYDFITEFVSRDIHEDWVEPIEIIKDNDLLLDLLESDELAQLMTIPYDPEAAKAAEAAQVAGSETVDNEVIIMEAVSETLGKNVGSIQQLTDEEIGQCTELDLRNTEISDCELFEKFVNLNVLNLHGTPITDCKPLGNLHNLHTLSLTATHVTDCSPLENLKKLSRLYLNATQLSDCKPLENLTNLKTLYLSNTKIDDCEPLKNLVSLTTLYLSNTKINDCAALEKLHNLKTLYLHGTQVYDCKPLEELTKLTTLYLHETRICDCKPLENLINLKTLYLNGTPVTDCRPLENLTSLKTLHLNRSQISDCKPLRNLANLTTLDLGGTKIIDCEPLENLSKLSKLSLNKTQVTNCKPLKNLSNLKEVDLSGTQITDYKPLENLLSLTKLFLSGTVVSDDDIQGLKSALPNLDIIR